MTRRDWQQLAERWLVDAKHLLDGGHWSAAYYLAGYTVECGLKSCILARLSTSPEVIFSEKRFSERCWTHNIIDLTKMADLEATRQANTIANPALEKNWLVVIRWTEEARYTTKSQQEAERLFAAITDQSDGVMQWIKAHW